MFRKSNYTAMAIAVGFGLTLSACASGESTGGAAGGDCSAGSGPIVIANVTDLSGAQSPLGTGENGGIRTAAQLINDSGGLLGGRKIEVKSFDTESNPDKAVPQANAAVAVKPVAIIGGEISDTVIAATNISHRARIPWLTPGGTSAQITARGFGDVFQVVPNTRQSAQAYHDVMLFLAKSVGAGKKMSIAVSDTTYGKSLDSAFTQINNASHAFDVAEKISYPLSTTDLSAIAARAVRPSPDIIYNEGYPTDGLNLGRLFAGKVNTSAKIFLSTATEAVVAKELGASANGMVLSAPVSASMKGIPTTFGEFRNAYTKQFPGTAFSSSTTAGYTGMRFVAAAIAKAGCAQPEAIAAALHNIALDHKNGNVYPQENLSFDKDGSLKQPPTFFSQIQNGKPVNIYPEATAAGKPIPFR